MLAGPLKSWMSCSQLLGDLLFQRLTPIFSSVNNIISVEAGEPKIALAAIAGQWPSFATFDSRLKKNMRRARSARATMAFFYLNSDSGSFN